MKNRKNGILTLSLALLLALPAFAFLAPSTFAEENAENNQSLQVQTEQWGVWYKFETPLITLIFPAKGTKPMFLWWYTDDNSTIYVVKFQGVIEYLIFDKPYYLKRFHADSSTINATLWKNNIEPKLRHRYGYGPGSGYNRAVMEFLGLLLRLHSAYLPFNACNWTLTGPELVVDGNSSYYSFNFTLTEVYGHGHPQFQFAENNIEIRCRFYNTTTTEVLDKEHNYTVAAGQLKFDFVVNNWQWNIDNINNFLREHNVDIEIPENRTGLALWVNMASIKIEDLKCAENEVQSQNQFENQVEANSQARGVMVGGEYYDVRNNETDQDEKPLQLRERFRERVRIQFAKGETTFSGFLEFVPWARLLDESGNTVDYVNVTASYIAAGGHLRLFVCYPYFGNYTLEHDPTVGLDYAPAIPELTTPNLLWVLIGATVVIAVALVAVRVLKKPVNVLAVK